MANIQFLGATKTVTGSKYLLSIDNMKILIDCGLFQGLKSLRLRNWEDLPFNPRELTAVILTHAHIDHSGYLPRLVAQGYNGPVYATIGTTKLCKLLLPDSARLQEEDARYANKQGFSKHAPARPLYTEKNAKASLQLFQSYHYNQEVRLSPSCSFHFLAAGHILGSSFINMRIKSHGQEIKVLFSGDLGRYDVPILSDPTTVTEADYIVVESTYGDRLHDTTPVKDQLAEIINQTVDRGGHVIIPAFAVGRTQEILYYLRELEEEKRIPILPVKLDSPMAQFATQQYMNNFDDFDEEMHNLIVHHINPLKTKIFNYGAKHVDDNIYDVVEPTIIISASGMATGGRILHYLKRYLPDEHSTILFTGFQAEGTRGRRLLEGETEVKIHGEMIPVKAKIAFISGLSAHADYKDTLRWLEGVQTKPKCVFITHGEPAAAQSLKEKIEARFNWETAIPDYEEVFELTAKE